MRLHTFFSRSGKSIGVAGAVVTISDLMQPLAPVAAYVMAASAIAMVIILGARFLGSFWNESLAVSTYLSCGIFVLSSALYFIQTSTPQGKYGGLIGSSIPLVSVWQEDLGIVEKKLTLIEERLGEVKREVSLDPKKELANKGVSWTYDNFSHSISGRHYDLVELFAAGGMKLDFFFFQNYLKHWYTPESAKILIRHEAFSDSACNFSKDNFRLYAEQSNDQGKISILRAACAKNSNLDALRYLRDEVSREHNAVIEVVGGNPENPEHCIRVLAKPGRGHYSSLCANGAINGGLGSSLYDDVTRGVCVEMIAGRKLLPDGRVIGLDDSFLNIVSGVCARAESKFRLGEESLKDIETLLSIYWAVAGAECNTVIGVKQVPHDAWPSVRS